METYGFLSSIIIHFLSFCQCVVRYIFTIFRIFSQTHEKRTGLFPPPCHFFFLFPFGHTQKMTRRKMPFFSFPQLHALLKTNVLRHKTPFRKRTTHRFPVLRRSAWQIHPLLFSTLRKVGNGTNERDCVRV